MTRQAWNTIKHSKAFYVRIYRKGGRWSIVSLTINVLLALAIYYAHSHEIPSNFYATNGMVAPIQLNPLNSPNDSAGYLLAPDPVYGEEERLIPQ